MSELTTVLSDACSNSHRRQSQCRSSSAALASRRKRHRAHGYSKRFRPGRNNRPAAWSYRDQPHREQQKCPSRSE
jgi:hypothetical protein